MCGIFGCMGSLDAEKKNRISTSLKHRGPDGQYFKEFNSLTFFHARLSIIDVAGGNQPFETEKVVLVFNGEIYNYKELAKKYQLSLNTQSDTEVIIALYAKMGTAAFEQLDGMFAFALYDKQEKNIYLVRDRSGKKPLYFSPNNGFSFASEINALLVYKSASDVNHHHLKWYLQKGFVSGENTIYNDIFEVLPAHYYTYNVETHKISRSQYWKFEDYFLSPKIKDKNVALEQLDDLFAKAVEKRILSSDFEVGAFLSGGIDSSLVCAFAVKTNPNLKTFTVKMKGGFDESEVASLIAKQLKTSHHELTIDYDSLSDDYEKIVTSYGEPIIDESIIPSYYVAKAASEHVRVILNGDGGDEIFGGYRRYVLYKNYEKIKLFSALGKNILGLLPATDNKNGSLSKLNRLSEFFKYQNEQQYFSATTDLFFDAPDYGQLEDVNYLSHKSWSNTSLTLLEKTMLTDFYGILPKILFKKMDIATMQSSIEGRSPFLDTDLMEWSAALDQNLKIKGFTSKYLLRELNKKYIDGSVYKLPKKGFEVSVKDLLCNQLKEMSMDYLHSSNCYYTNFIDQKYVHDFYLNKGKINDVKRYKGLFALLNLEIWHKNLNKR
ncbi:asparagine synthase (glutamine-hydrolyzing) [Flavobacterium sp.]|uniref:asparagine synthase (glutamine-hydrolyzing) n=1 Tax=Flavobacterium sp. TaxID=239 RepID=UPI00391CA6E4